MSDPIYLDHNGTTPVAPEVADAMWPYLTRHYGNPSSTTPAGRTAKAAVERAREQVAALLGAQPDEITFTSGGTESNNLAIRGSAAVARTRRAVSTVVEHPATEQPLRVLEADGWDVVRLPVDAAARVSASDVPGGPWGLGTVILAHNETGTVQPVAELAERVHAGGGVMHADAAQAVGKLRLDVEELGVDLLSVAGHKLYAPKAVGALYVRRGTRVAPVLVGAGQERGLRPGTENVASIVGLGVAAELAAAKLTDEPAREEGLRELLWGLLAAGIPGLRRLSPAAGCLPNTLLVLLPGAPGFAVLDAAPGVEASTGSACHAGVHEPGATVLAMGVPAAEALGTVRLSLGRSTTEEQVRAATAELVRAWESVRG